MNFVTKTNTFEFWDKNRGTINTEVGQWIGGKGAICHGHTIIDPDADSRTGLLSKIPTAVTQSRVYLKTFQKWDKEWISKFSYMQMLILSATGKQVDKKVADWIEGNFIGLSYPDARIWCNQIGALAGTCKTSVAAATIVGALASDSRAYGCQTNKTGIEFIHEALIAYNNGQSIQEIVEQPKYKHRFNKERPDIPGFARPVNRQDERIRPYEKLYIKLGFKLKEQKHLKLAKAIGLYLEENYQLGMNSGGYASAFLADQGFTPDEACHLKSLSVYSGVMACAIDNREKGPNSFLPLRCNDILYNGLGKRDINKNTE